MKGNEIEATNASARLAAIVRSSHDAIIGQDLAGIITSWNPGAECLYGYTPKDVIGRHSGLLATSSYRATEAALLGRIANGEHIRMVRTKRIHQDGSSLDVSLSVSPITDTDMKIVGMATSSREIGDILVAESQFQGVLEAAPDAMVSVDSDGLIMLVNGQVEKLFGWSRAELIGRPVEVLVPIDLRHKHPQLRKSYALHPTMRPMGANNSQLSAQRKDGSTFPVDISLGSVQIGSVLTVTAAVRDVSGRVADQNALRTSEANFRQLAASIDVGFVLRSLAPAETIYESPGFTRIFGPGPSAGNGAPDATMQRVHPDDREQVDREYWQFARRGEPAELEWRIIRADGQTRWIRTKSKPVTDPDGVVRRAASTVEDITERKLSESALRLAHAQAEAANAAKNEFLSRMSHELRTPLNAVLGFAQLLELDQLNDDQQAAVQYILRGGRHLLGLIDDVLDITKIESDRLDVSIEPLLVVELVTEAIEMMRPFAAGTAVALNQHTDGSESWRVLGDRRRLRQVLLNLISNAIKYNRDNGTVTVACREVTGSIIEIDVIDSGRGIHKNDLPRLFTPFDRLDAQASGIEGAGVGLALSQRLMSSMNGALKATSHVGIGSTFTASIPMTAAAQVATISGPDTPLAVPIPPVGRPTHTLVYIEDNASNTTLMVSLLGRRPQWRMIVARTGEEGLAIINADVPNLVLLDLHLPDTDGIDVLRRLRARQGTDSLKVVVVSADASQHQIDRLLAAGAYDYLTKPLDISKVLQLLDATAQNH